MTKRAGKQHLAVWHSEMEGGTRPLIREHPQPNKKLRRYCHAKRGLDLLLVILSLPVVVPIGILVAIAVLISSGRPIFYWHHRIGMGGRPFALLKFRTMVKDADRILETDHQFRAHFESKFKLDDDPRITPIGRILRRTCLDELPQLFNVLRGELSMVGPRPIIGRELAKYGRHQDRLLSAIPGVTGFWQVSRTSQTSYTERVAMDMQYIESRSLLLDLSILVKTPLALLRRKNGAC